MISSFRTCLINLKNLKLSHLPLNRGFHSSFVNNQEKSIKIYYIDRDNEKREAKAKIGSNLLDVALDNNIDLEGFGACEGTLSCSTCHLILNKENYEQLKPASDEENDMLDLAFGLTETSRLGCQIVVDEKMANWVFKVPAEVSDARG